MTATIQDLYDFIDTATRNRKYPISTAQGLRAALKLFDGELSDEERKSVDSIKGNIEQIYQSVFAKNKNFTAASLATYKSRMLKVINDYEKYGTDPTKMSSWNPKVITRSKRSARDTNTRSEGIDVQDSSPDVAQDVIANNMHKIELALRADTKFVLILPRDLKQTEVDVLNNLLTSLVFDGGEDGTSRVQETSSQ